MSSSDALQQWASAAIQLPNRPYGLPIVTVLHMHDYSRRVLPQMRGFILWVLHDPLMVGEVLELLVELGN
jgi:hypothetical protein